MDVNAPKDWLKDITKQDIQGYLVDYYGSADAPPHQALTSQTNRCTSTAITNTGTLSFPQSVVSTVMKGFASTPTTNRGLLAWHSTGSGKTASAIAVMDAFWDTRKTIVFATSVEASNSNPPSTFHKTALKLFPRFKGMTEEQVKREFEKRGVKFFTFATLAHYLLIANPLTVAESNVQKHKSFLNHAVLIIDEVHNIFRPLPNQKAENNAVKKFLMDYDSPYTKNTKLVILTATPGDTPEDVVDLLNMIRDKNSKPIQVPKVSSYKDMERFQQDVKGLISYFDMSKDYSRFPKLEFEEATKVPLSTKQFIKYSDQFLNEPNENKNATTLMANNQFNNYYKHSRKYSNMLFDFDKDMLLDEFSAKLPALLAKIQQFPMEKHYVYSSFGSKHGFGGQGIVSIAKMMEAQLGYEKMTVSQAQEGVQKHGQKRRYVLAVSSELSEDRENLRALVSAFNDPSNARGEYVHVFLASQGYNEGIDLKGVRHIHLFEPLLTFAANKQTIGRGVRYCSHSDLSRERGEWTVKVHRYISDTPMDLSMFNMNYIKDRVQYLNDEIAKLELKMSIVQDKTASSKAFKDELKASITEYKKLVGELEKKAKEVEKVNIKNVRMIDTQIFKEAMGRSREIMMMYNAMKNAAIDYRLFADYHEA